MKVSDAKTGTWIMHRGEAAKVVKKERVTVGTHMHSKTRLTVQGLITGKSEVLTLGHHENLEDINVDSKIGQVIAKIAPDEIQLMDVTSYETLSVKVSPSVYNAAQEGTMISFLDVNGRIIVPELKE
jgi:translation elongation factor P/translation initiation factor 5A